MTIQELKQEYELTRIALCRERNMIKRTALSARLGLIEKELTEKRKEASTRRLLENDEELSLNFVCDALTAVAMLDKVTDLVMDIQKRYSALNGTKENFDALQVIVDRNTKIITEIVDKDTSLLSEAFAEAVEDLENSQEYLSLRNKVYKIIHEKIRK